MFRLVEYVEIDSLYVPEKEKMRKIIEENKNLPNMMPLQVVKEDEE